MGKREQLIVKDGLHSRAAAYLDKEFARSQDFLFREHRRDEHGDMAFHNSQSQGFSRPAPMPNSGTAAGAQHRREAAPGVIALHRRHTSIGRQLTALTKQG